MNLKTLILSGFIVVGTAFAQNACDLEIVKNEIETIQKILDQNPNALNPKEGFFKGVKCENGELIYDYLYNDEISDYFSREVTPDGEKKALKSMQDTMSALYCNTEAMSEFRKNEVPLTYNYSTANKKNLFVVRLNKNSCKKK